MDLPITIDDLSKLINRVGFSVFLNQGLTPEYRALVKNEALERRLEAAEAKLETSSNGTGEDAEQAEVEVAGNSG